MKFRHVVLRGLFRAFMAATATGCSVAAWVLAQAPWMLHAH